jgi:NAD(P)H-dependent FMN reductase
MMTISVIVGSTRQGRFSEKPAQWILQQLHKRERIEGRLLDFRDFTMPFFDQPMPPATPGRPPYEHDAVKKWTAQIAASDAFVFATRSGSNTSRTEPLLTLLHRFRRSTFG